MTDDLRTEVRDLLLEFAAIDPGETNASDPYGQADGSWCCFCEAEQIHTRVGLDPRRRAFWGGKWRATTPGTPIWTDVIEHKPDCLYCRLRDLLEKVSMPEGQ